MKSPILMILNEKTFSECKGDDVRVIFEGGAPDYWLDFHQIGISKLYLPKNINQLSVIPGYTFNLVGKSDNFGRIESVPTPNKSRDLPEYKLNSSRPTTIITEDGRIFHDIHLRKSETENDPNSLRLENILKSLFGSGHTFSQVHEMIAMNIGEREEFTKIEYVNHF